MRSEQLVHEVDETQLEGAKWRVPLPVPMRVGDDVDPTAGRAELVGVGREPVIVGSRKPSSCRLRLQYPPARIGVVAGDGTSWAGSSLPASTSSRARTSAVPSSERGTCSSQISSCHGTKPSP